jgi:hypothetical protein
MDLELELRLRIDPAELMRCVGLDPDPWQSEVMRSTSRRVLLLASRQIGKSTVCSLMALWTAYFCEQSLTLLVAPVERQAELLFRKVSAFHKQLGLVDGVKELSLSLELANGSEIRALPGSGDSIRGFSAPDLIICDEAARLDPSVMPAISPMLVGGGGRLVLLSTPHGKTGSFYEAWVGGDPSWHRINARAADSPRVSPEELERQRAELGERQFSAEFANQFLEDVDAVFTEDAIQRLLEVDDPSVALPALDLEAVWNGLLRRL